MTRLLIVGVIAAALITGCSDSGKSTPDSSIKDKKVKREASLVDRAVNDTSSNIDVNSKIDTSSKIDTNSKIDGKLKNDGAAKDGRISADGPKDCSAKCVKSGGFDLPRPYCAILDKSDSGPTVYAWFDGCDHTLLHQPLAPDMPLYCQSLSCCAICDPNAAYKGWYDSCSGELIGDPYYGMFCDEVI